MPRSHRNLDTPRRRFRVTSLRWYASGVLAVFVAFAPTTLRAQLLAASPSLTEGAATVLDAYVYAYPLIAMEMVRRAQTNAGDGAPATTPSTAFGARAPLNQFGHQRTLPDAATTTLQRPNVDTILSTLWFDVGPEPLVLAIPAAGDRYYTLAMLDLWSDVFAAPGPRTSGSGPQTYALTARGWTGTLPAGVVGIEAPTNVGAVLVRIAAAGPTDLAAAHQLQDGFTAVPLSQWGTTSWTPPRGTFDAAVDMRSPWEQIPRLPAETFFKLFATLTKANPPHPNDWPIRQRLAQIGIVPGTPLAISSLGSDVRTALTSVPTTAGQTLFESFKRAGARVNGWRLLGTPLGTYGTDYRRRHVIAYSALGAPLPEDLLFLTTIAEGVDGRPLESGDRYTMHFDADRLPPANAFWSITAYDERQLLPATKGTRVAVGDRDALAKNADGSIDLLLQRDPPAGDQAANWLPLPLGGRFSLMMRLWWPKPAALDGTWVPPPVVARVPQALATP